MVVVSEGVWIAEGIQHCQQVTDIIVPVLHENVAELGARSEEPQLLDQPVLGLDLYPASGRFLDCGDIRAMPFECEPVPAQIRDTIDWVFPNAVLAREGCHFLKVVDQVLLRADLKLATM